METIKTATTRALNVKRYGRLLAAALPMVITTETEYDRLRATLEELVSRDEDDLSPEEVKLLDLLVTSTRMIHERFYCNGGFATATSLHTDSTVCRRAGSPLSRSTSCLKYWWGPRAATRPTRQATPQNREEN